MACGGDGALEARRAITHHQQSGRGGSWGEQQHQIPAGHPLQMGTQGEELAGLGRGQALQPGTGMVEHLDPGIDQLPGTGGQHGLGTGTGDGPDVDHGLTEREGKPQGNGIEFTNRVEGIVRNRKAGWPFDHSPGRRGRGKSRHHEGFHQVVTHHQVTDQVADGLALKGHAIATGEGGKRGIETHLPGAAIGEHLPLNPIITELKQNLAREKTGLQRPDPFLQILNKAGNLQRNAYVLSTID